MTKLKLDQVHVVVATGTARDYNPSRTGVFAPVSTLKAPLAVTAAESCSQASALIGADVERLMPTLPGLLAPRTTI